MANVKITQLTNVNSVVTSDLIPVVITPDTTPISRKVKVGPFLRTLNLPWLILPDMTYVSPTSATATGDKTSFLAIGTKLKCTNVTVKYGYILSSTYSSGTGLTTVNLVANTSFALVNSAITDVYISYGDPPDFPYWLNFIPGVFTQSGAFTTVSTAGRFSISGRTVTHENDITITTNGTAVGVQSYIPVASAGYYVFYGHVGSYLCYAIGNGPTYLVLRYDGVTNINGDGVVVHIRGNYKV